MHKLKLVVLMIIFSMSAFAADFDQSHKVWSDVLTKHVAAKGGQAFFNYKALKKDSKSFEGYLSTLSALSSKDFEKFSRDQKMAFLINAYNAFTVKLVIDNYPVKSIKDIGGIFSSPWKKEFYTLLGKKRNLDYIEHGVLRVKYKEPRVHYAVNCASLGCPNLQNKAFTADNLEAMLAKGEKDFFNQSEKNNVDKKAKEVNVSKIFDWFGVDFKNKYGSVAKYLASVVNTDSDTKAKIASGKFDIEYTDYSWKLNETK